MPQQRARLTSHAHTFIHSLMNKPNLLRHTSVYFASRVFWKRSERKRLFIAGEGDVGEQFGLILDQRAAEAFQLIVRVSVDRNHHDLDDRQEEQDVEDEPRDEAEADGIQHPRNRERRMMR